MFMRICFWDGINACQIKVEIEGESGIVFKRTYTYGRDIAISDSSLPTAGDVLRDVVERYRIESNNIEYSGYNAFMGKPFSESQLENRIEKLLMEV